MGIDETIVPILSDFEIFVDYLERNRIKLSSREGWIPPKILYELNTKMSYVTPNPTLRTPQKYYVLLNLLYYLATESRLFNKVREKGAFYLEATDRVKLYRELTSTEKYFFLLETLWRDIDWRFLDIDQLYRDDPLIGVQMIFSSLVPEETSHKKVKKRKYFPVPDFRLHRIVFILYLFRLLDVSILTQAENFILYFKYDIPIDRIRSSSLGELLLPILVKERDILHWNLPWRIQNFGEINPIPGSSLPDEIEKLGIKSSFVEVPFFLPFIRLFREELKKTLPRVIEKVKFIDGIYTFKVSIKYGKNIWRRIKIPADYTLFDLGEVILDAYRFDHDHLSSFFMDGKKWSPYEFTSPYSEEGPHSSDVRIGELNLYMGQKFLYLYDYGDEWEFEIKLESIEQEKMTKPKIVERHGKAPPQYIYY